MKKIIYGCFLCTLLIAVPQPGMAGTDSDPAPAAANVDIRANRIASHVSSPVLPSSAPEMEHMRQLLEEMHAQLDDQRALNEKQSVRLAALESELATMRHETPSAIVENTTKHADAAPPLSAAGTSSSDSTKDDASPLFFKIGRANFTPGGYLDFTTVFRSKTVGSGIATTFGTIPYAVPSSYPAAGLSEFRMSSQNSRVSLKVDSQVGQSKVYGYLETDFLGNNASTMDVTSNSATMRLRIALADITLGKWDFLGGQSWSLMTPNRKGLSPMPGDLFYSYDADSNYQLGVVWARQPQIRAVYHANDSWALGFSAENPQQVIGSAVTVPSTFLSAQVDTMGAAWGANTNTPNVSPDLISKIAYDTRWNGKSFHMDSAAMLRTFRINTFVAATGTAPQINANDTAFGRAFSFNMNLELFKKFHVIENAFWSEGGGRYVLGLAPDFVVRPPNASGIFDITPLQVASWVGGAEWQASPRVMLYGYYSGVYANRQYFTVPANTICGSLGYCGYGNPGSASTNNRTIQESTFGLSRTMWSSPELGKLVAHTQISYLSRSPWSVTAGTPGNANLIMIYAAMKYVLP